MRHRILGKSKMGKNCIIQENVIVGAPSKDLINLDKDNLPGAVVGNDCTLRSGSVIYSNVKIGNKLNTGHNVLVRENTIIGDNVLIGTNSIIENDCVVGNNVSIQSNVYIPTNSKIGDFVFLGPNACLLNDKYPLRIKPELRGPTIKNGATIGANSTILPGVIIGEGAVVAAGAVVTKDIAPWKLAIGVPARETKLPSRLKVQNRFQ